MHSGFKDRIAYCYPEVGVGHLYKSHHIPSGCALYFSHRAFRTSSNAQRILMTGLPAAILRWGWVTYTKAITSLRAVLFIFLIVPFEQVRMHVSKNKKPSLRMAFVEKCRGDRIRTCDPLVPNLLLLLSCIVPTVLCFIILLFL